jgi:hypothetical protein
VGLFVVGVASIYKVTEIYSIIFFTPSFNSKKKLIHNPMIWTCLKLDTSETTQDNIMYHINRFPSNKYCTLSLSNQKLHYCNVIPNHTNIKNCNAFQNHTNIKTCNAFQNHTNIKTCNAFQNHTNIKTCNAFPTS